MIGTLIFKNDRADLGDDGKWTGANQDFVDTLNIIFGADDYSPGDGPFGFMQLAKARWFFGGSMELAMSMYAGEGDDGDVTDIVY